MEIEKHIIKPYTMNGGGYRYIGQGKVPTICAMYHNVFSTFPEKPYIMEIDKNIEENGYIKVDRKLKPKRNQDKASTLTVGGHGAGNHSDMDLFCVGMRGRESACLTPKRTEYGKQIRKQYEAGEIREQRKYIQQLEPREDGKTNTLTTVQKDNMVMEKYHIDDNDNLIVPEATSLGHIEVQPGECFDGTYPKSTTRRGRKMDDKSNCLMSQRQELYRYELDRKPIQLNPAKEFGNQPRQRNRVYDVNASSPAMTCTHPTKVFERRCRIRRLTPTECARLQSIPDWYEWKGKFPDGKVKPTSDTQIYRMCGNGWNVEVIKHIFSFIDLDKYEQVCKADNQEE